MQKLLNINKIFKLDFLFYNFYVFINSSKLNTKIDFIKENNLKKLRTKVDLGSNFYVNAEM